MPKLIAISTHNNATISSNVTIPFAPVALRRLPMTCRLLPRPLLNTGCFLFLNCIQLCTQLRSSFSIWRLWSDEDGEAFDSAENWSMVNMSSRALSKAFLVLDL